VAHGDIDHPFLQEAYPIRRTQAVGKLYQPVIIVIFSRFYISVKLLFFIIGNVQFGVRKGAYVLYHERMDEAYACDVVISLCRHQLVPCEHMLPAAAVFVGVIADIVHQPVNIGFVGVEPCFFGD
jgi:hypothetical protein